MDLNALESLGVVAAGVATGVLSALFGVGGGIIMVPFMVVALGFNQHVAEGTSLLVIVPTATAGVLAHFRKGFVSFRDGGLLAIGGVSGAYAGALLAQRLDPDTLQRLFGAFVLAVGVRHAWRGYRTRSPAD